MIASSTPGKSGRAGAAPPPPEISLTGDYRILKQALLNLLTNAMKFTPAGGRVSLTGNLSADGGLDLTVSDTGIGIAQENLQQIFQPFFQVADPHCRTTSGSGLGLAIVQRVVDLHDGHIAVSSQLGKGTQMKITLPASRIARGHKHPG